MSLECPHALRDLLVWEHLLPQALCVRSKLAAHLRCNCIVSELRSPCCRYPSSGVLHWNWLHFERFQLARPIGLNYFVHRIIHVLWPLRIFHRLLSQRFMVKRAEESLDVGSRLWGLTVEWQNWPLSICSESSGIPPLFGTIAVSVELGRENNARCLLDQVFNVAIMIFYQASKVRVKQRIYWCMIYIRTGNADALFNIYATYLQQQSCKKCFFAEATKSYNKSEVS